jgi:hypothetical protein
LRVGKPELGLERLDEHVDHDPVDEADRGDPAQDRQRQPG